MNSYLGVSIVILYFIIMFVSVGYICKMIFGCMIDKFMQPVYGAVVYFFVLAMIYVPIQFTNKSLSLFSTIVGILSVLLIVLVLFMLIVSIKQIKKEIRCCSRFITRDNMLWAALFVVFFIFLIFYTTDITFYASGSDSSYYNGIINSTVQSGLLNANEPYTGSPMSYSFFRQIMFYESFVAVISEMFSIHPLIVVNRVVGICEVLTYHYVVFLTARKLLKNSKKAICAMGIVFYINMFMNTIYTPANFLFYRLGEPKSLTANITLPLMLLFICNIYDDYMKHSYWIGLFMIIVVGLLVNNSALILIPTALFALLLPINIKMRKGKVFINSLICFIPCIAFVILIYIL